MVNNDPGITNPVIISAVTATPSAGQVVIAWTTNIAASSLVKYGRSPNMDKVTPETDTSPLVTSHSVTITGLQAGKAYLFQIISRQDSGKDGMNITVMNGHPGTYNGSFVSV